MPRASVAQQLRDYEARGAEPQDGTWRTRWEEFCHRQAHYRFIPEDIRDLFSHYLDCEAHTDVWREIYPTRNKTNERRKNDLT